MRSLTTYLLIVLTFSLTALADSQPGTKKDHHIYLLIGQSNMAGRAQYGDELKSPIKRAFLLDGNDEWSVAQNPLNIYSTIRKGPGMQRLGPGYGFAKEMLQNQPEISIGLIVNAKGGTKIEQWKQGTKFYDEAVRRTKVAMKSGTLKGILWHQGESNQGNPDAYPAQLKALVENLRKDLSMDRLPFIAGQVNNVPKINEAIARLPEEVDVTAYVSSEGLTCTDRWHFDTESVLLMGKRYAEEMLVLQKLK